MIDYADIPYEDMPPATTWELPHHVLNKLQQASITEVVRMAKHAHMTDIVLRIDGRYVVYQADWIKSLEPKL